MKIKNEKIYLTIKKSEINRYIAYILKARNTFIEQEKPIDDVNDLLERMLKIKKKLRV